MESLFSTTMSPGDGHPPLPAIGALILNSDASCPKSENCKAHNDLEQPVTTTTGRRTGKSMSRRKGQNGMIEKHGKYYTLRVWMDVEGQEARVHDRIKISPIKRGDPGWLNASERSNRAKAILAEIGANSPERFDAVVRVVPMLRSRTFAEQAEILLEDLRQRNDPAANSTLEHCRSAFDRWLNPLLGELPLDQISNSDLKHLVKWMKKGGPPPSEGE